VLFFHTLSKQSILQQTPIDYTLIHLSSDIIEAEENLNKSFSLNCLYLLLVTLKITSLGGHVAKQYINHSPTSFAADNTFNA
jgi:hypothetical protein